MTPGNKGTKGKRTRAAILDAGFHIVSKAGLEGLTIDTLTRATRQAIEQGQLAPDTDPASRAAPALPHPAPLY